MLFLLRDENGDAWVNGLEMDRLTEAGASLRHGPKGDLYHVGCVGMAERESHLEQWLARHPGYEQREQQQAYALITKYMPMRYGWNK